MCMTQENEHTTKCFDGAWKPAFFNYVLKKYYISHNRYIYCNIIYIDVCVYIKIVYNENK